MQHGPAAGAMEPAASLRRPSRRSIMQTDTSVRSYAMAAGDAAAMDAARPWRVLGALLRDAGAYVASSLQGARRRPHDEEQAVEGTGREPSEGARGIPCPVITPPSSTGGTFLTAAVRPAEGAGGAPMLMHMDSQQCRDWCEKQRQHHRKRRARAGQVGQDPDALEEDGEDVGGPDGMPRTKGESVLEAQQTKEHSAAAAVHVMSDADAAGKARACMHGCAVLLGLADSAGCCDEGMLSPCMHACMCAPCAGRVRKRGAVLPWRSGNEAWLPAAGCGARAQGGQHDVGGQPGRQRAGRLGLGECGAARGHHGERQPQRALRPAERRHPVRGGHGREADAGAQEFLPLLRGSLFSILLGTYVTSRCEQLHASSPVHTCSVATSGGWQGSSCVRCRGCVAHMLLFCTERAALTAAGACMMLRRSLWWACTSWCCWRPPSCSLASR
jgi:hypothetical protein